MVSNQRRDFAEAPPKFPNKPIEKQELPPIYGNMKANQKQP